MRDLIGGDKSFAFTKTDGKSANLARKLERK